MPAEAQWSFLKKWTPRECQVMMRGSVEKQPWWCRPDLAFRWVSLCILLSSGNNHEFYWVEWERKWARAVSYVTEKVTGFFLIIVLQCSSNLPFRLWPLSAVCSVNLRGCGAEFSWFWFELVTVECTVTGLGPCSPSPKLLQKASIGDLSSPRVWLMHFRPLKHLHIDTCTCRNYTHTHTQRPFHFLSEETKSFTIFVKLNYISHTTPGNNTKALHMRCSTK